MDQNQPLTAEQVFASDAVNTGNGMLDAAYELHESRQFAEAEKIYDQLLTQNHDNPGLLATVGTLYLQTGRYGMALSLLHRAADKMPMSDIYCSIGTAYKYLKRSELARTYFEKSIAHNPTASSFANYASLFIEADHDRALELIGAALKLEPEHALAHWHQAMVMLAHGQWDQAWDESEYGFDARVRVRRNIDNLPYWDGTKGKTIAVYGEQGLGDEIMFASMLPDLMKDNTVILECHRRLKTLFEASFPGLICYGTREEPESTWCNQHDLDYAVSIGSLGKWFRRSREAFPGTPYLKADSATRGEKFRVGISWTGGLKEGRVRIRQIPLPWWKSILDNDCEFISLQYTDCDDDLAAMSRLGYAIQAFPEVKAEDYNETAKLVKSCDLIISCCTSLIHLAGALGVPCWVMVPSAPAWRYQVSGGMPFYKSVRLYRQPKGSDWMPVIQRVGYDLSQQLIERRAA